ncbi:Uncharacterised protein [Bordetella pertussis]|nr:Uncharacterised protein [Bordetella pertussis]
MQVQGQEVVPHRFAARGEGALDHFQVGHLAAPVVEPAQAGHVGDGLQVENERGRHRGGRYCIGSTGVPWRRISKCSRGDVVSVSPISAILAPRLTFWPVLTSSARLCA